MSRDSTSTYLHLHHSHHADLLETFTHPHSSQLAPEEIYIPPHLQPINPEDEDDVVPDQHAAFGIQKATQNNRVASWRDLGLDELVRRGPGEGAAEGVVRVGSGVGTRGVAPGRRDEPVRLALRRQPGAGTVGIAGGSGSSGAGGSGEQQGGGGGGVGNGLPR
ncbi:Apc13p-domain-containing protein [Pleomassaria siparia CBS 279.74]|uniref:Apc13p-domain-containing protein n=1 Tax=Pleomassaria siparia CBS 279.74 TaxID=1314801 RepID=A0A6G1JZW2_9PLEO|nr:Apc13p-domain-containing protein [Pleomassaria siparia CBS 279.74]